MPIIEDKYIINSVVLAKYIVSYANENHFVINMTKLQKLLYITYGLYLAVTGKRLTNEHPQAWPYGPVFPTTRNRFLKVDWNDIQISEVEGIPTDIQKCVKIVFNSFGKYNASYLSSWSHQKNSPWDRTVKLEDFKWGDAIPDEYILPYFKTLIVKKKDNGK